MLLVISVVGLFYLLQLRDQDLGKPIRWMEEQPRDPLKIAILIDDIGYDFKVLNELITMDAPLTFAVLPHYPHSRDAARTLHEKSKEILLHLPMEPHAYPDEQPGAGALLLKMSVDEIGKQVNKDIAAVPFVSGVNNHMGSRFMEDEAKLSTVFNQLKKKNLFFVDSRTTPATKAKEIATLSGVPFISRKILIDSEHNYRATLQNLIKLREMAQHENSEPVLVIGHPYPETIQTLRKALPVLKAQGVLIVPVSHLVKQ